MILVWNGWPSGSLIGLFRHALEVSGVARKIQSKYLFFFASGIVSLPVIRLSDYGQPPVID